MGERESHRMVRPRVLLTTTDHPGREHPRTRLRM